MKQAKTTKELLRNLPSQYSEAFYDNLAEFPQDVLWDFIIELLPVERAERMLADITSHWEEDEFGMPYKKFKAGKR
jgi:hypothetical protein